LSNITEHVRLEKLTVAQTADNFLAFCGIQKFIIADIAAGRVHYQLKIFHSLKLIFKTVRILRNAYRILVGNEEVKRPLGRPRRT
jgi:hypothetical protein